MKYLHEILLLSFAISVICSVMGFRRKKTNGALFFGMLMLSSAIYSFGYACQLETLSMPEIIFWTKFQYIGISFLPYWWLVFALFYSGNDSWLTPIRNAMLLIVPAVTLVLSLTMESNSLYYISVSPIRGIPIGSIEIEKGIWYWVHQFYAVSLIFSGNSIFYNMYYKAPAPYRRHAGIVLAGSTLPFICYLIYEIGYVPYSIDLIPFALSISGVVYLIGLTKKRFLKLIPIAREKVFENMMGSVLIFDPANNLVDYNPRAKGNFSFINEQLIGKNVGDIFTDCKDIQTHINLLDYTNQTFQSNLEIRGKTYSCGFSIISDSGSKMTGKLLILNDITEMIEIENKLITKSEELKVLLTDKDKFFSIIAHDLRGPFQGFLGLSGLLATDAESMTTEEIKELSSELNKALMTQFNFLEELLQWAGLTTNRINLNLVKMNALDAIKDVVEVLTGNASSKDIRILVTNDGDPWLTADKDMLKLVVRNLLSNAIKFSYPGSKIDISLNAGNDYISITVTDEGVGMTEDNLKKIFWTNSHRSSEGTAKERGSGLGLILCKEIVEKHSGKIEAESIKGKGSRFTVTIPKINS